VPLTDARAKCVASPESTGRRNSWFVLRSYHLGIGFCTPDAYSEDICAEGGSTGFVGQNTKLKKGGSVRNSVTYPMWMAQHHRHLSNALSYTDEVNPEEDSSLMTQAQSEKQEVPLNVNTSNSVLSSAANAVLTAANERFLEYMRERRYPNEEAVLADFLAFGTSRTLIRAVAEWRIANRRGNVPPLDLPDLNQLATAFYKRISFRVPGLVEQIEDVAKPLRVALGMGDPTEETSKPL